MLCHRSIFCVVTPWMGSFGQVGLWLLSCCFDLGLCTIMFVLGGIKGIAASSFVLDGRRPGDFVRLSMSSWVGLFLMKLRRLRRQRRMKYIATAARPASSE